MDASSPLHIVICPWLAFGHLLPFLELAKRLASRGHRVSYVSTPRNLRRLPPLPPELAPLVDLVALPLPRIEGLPEGAESTNDVPFDKFELHRQAFDGLAAPFSAFLSAACAEAGKKPDWVIVDALPYWAAAAALDHKVPCAMFLLFGGYIIDSWPLWHPTEQGGAPSEQQPAATGQGQPAGAPAFEAEQAKMFTAEGASGLSIARRFSLTLERCKLVALRSCSELEPEVLPRLSTIGGKPAVPLGLLPQSPPPERARGAGKDRDEDNAIMRWLDAQPAKSVVYVALGSEVPLRVELVRELALGLELAGARFLWALRKPSAIADADVLPEGFEERTQGRGLVAMGRWVPQLRVLAHAAVAAYLTHCGWSSVIEGLQFGHPLIMLPILGEQGLTARLMGGRKVGMQVPRNEDDGSFDRDGVATAVRAVVVGEEGRVLADNAKKLQEIVADRESHERYIDQFIQHLRSYMG